MRVLERLLSLDRELAKHTNVTWRGDPWIKKAKFSTIRTSKKIGHKCPEREYASYITLVKSSACLIVLVTEYKRYKPYGILFPYIGKS